MKIVQTEILPCSQRLADANWKFARGAVRQLDGHVMVLRDEAGRTGLGYAHAIPAISTHGDGARSALSWLETKLVGREIGDIAAIIDDLDLALAFNTSAKAAIDMALHDLLARSLNAPLHVLLGGKRRDTVLQSRIVSLGSPSEMGSRAAELVQQGHRQVKLKLSADTAQDVARISSVRDAVGTDVLITLDPNQSYTPKQMMGAFARMERYDIALIEQPVRADDWKGLALLTKSLPVAIEADESAQTVDDVFRLVSERTVDAINLKITKLGGLRRFMQAVQLCEAGQVTCRAGAAFGPALLQAFSAHACSAIHSLPFACELSEHKHLLDDPFTPLPVINGVVRVPDGPGVGIAFAA